MIMNPSVQKPTKNNMGHQEQMLQNSQRERELIKKDTGDKRPQFNICS